MPNSAAPVIVHCSLANSDLTNRLQQKGHRLRYGTGTTEGSLIFPHGGPVFIIQQLTKTLQRWPPDSDAAVDSDLFARLTKAQQVHASLYLVTISPLLGLNELKVISLLQEMLPDLRILPTKDGRECADAVCNIVKVREGETRQLIEQRMETSIEDLKKSVFQDVVTSLPFQPTVKEELSKKFRSVAGLIQANEDNLREMDNSEHILEFFSEDKVTV